MTRREPIFRETMSQETMFRGVVTALITPFQEGKVDEGGLRKNVSFQLKKGVSALLALGTTGETSTLSLKEQERVVKIVVEEGGDIPVCVNVGDNCTSRTIEKAKRAHQMGAAALLAATPYYNHPTQEGLFCHFHALAAATPLPIILYHHPGRTGVSFTLETLLRLAKIPTIVGIKEASGDLSFICKAFSLFTQNLFPFFGRGFFNLSARCFGSKRGDFGFEQFDANPDD